MATQRGPKIVTNGLIFCLDAADRKSYSGSGATWTDLASRNIGTLTGTYAFNSGNGGHINLNGGGYATVPMNSALRPNNITLEAWVNFITTAPVSDTYRPISLQYGTSTGYSYFLWYIDGRFGIGINNQHVTHSYFALNGNTWYQVVGTYNGTTMRIYVNAIERSNGTPTSGNIVYDTNNTSLTIGTAYLGSGYNVGPGNSWRHRLASVKIYNRALSSTEILQNFTTQRGRFGI